MTVGQEIFNGPESPIKAGNTLPLRNIPVGSTIHCIELLPGKGAQLVRAAGTFGQLIAREGEYAQVRSAMKRIACANSARPVLSVGAVFVRRFVALL